MSGEFETLIMRDTRANQPAAGVPGRLYYVTDENVTERDNGSSWEDFTDAGSGGSVDDTAYDATTWNGDTTHAPSKNAVRDKIESMGAGGSVATDTIFDAKGDLPVGTGSDTAAKVTVGADGTVLYADSAQTAGVAWGFSGFGLRVLTPPSSSGWSWDNQVSSTIDSTNGYEYLTAPKQSAVKLSGRYRTPANSHWRIEVCMLHDISGAMAGSVNDMGYVIGFRDSSAKLVTTIMQVASSVPGVYSHKWTSSTSYSALYTSYTGIGTGDIVWKNPAWLRADYDGTNIVTYYSIDGNHWHQIDTRALTNFLGAGTPDFFWGAYVNGSGVNIALISYKETALP